MYEEIKQKQKTIIEKIHHPITWVKLEILNLLDKPIMDLPILDQQQFAFYIKSAEHKDGFPLKPSDYPLLRISKGKLLRDEYGYPDSYFWSEDTYLKNRDKYIHYLVGLDSAEMIANYASLREEIIDEDDANQISEKILSRKWPLEVIVTPAEQRQAVEVDEAILKELPSIIESYNDYDESALVELKIGDLLVLDNNGFYYRVERSLKEKTYGQGYTAMLDFEICNRKYKGNE